MNYSELLNKYIKDSGLSLSEISEKMEKEKGIKIDRSYISMLKNNKTKNPASEEINRALAEVTGGDPEKLVIAGYIEKAPEQIKNILKDIEDINEFFKRSFLLSIKLMSEDVDEFKRIMAEKYKINLEKSNFDERISIINQDPMSVFEELNIEQKIKFVTFAIQMAAVKKVDFEYLIDFLFKTQPPRKQSPSISNSNNVFIPNDLIRIPLLGSIRAGDPIERIEINEGYTLVEPEVLKGAKGFALRVKGESMAGDNIHDGYIVIVRVQPEVQPHDIAVVAINEEEATLKRVKIVGDMAMLTPSNPEYEPQLVPAKDIHIIGKVVEVKFWPK